MSGGQNRRDRVIKRPGNSGSGSELDEHELDQAVPEIEGVLSEIDKALGLADDAIETEKRAEQDRQIDRCVCW
jgi:hypothetical protein